MKYNVEIFKKNALCLKMCVIRDISLNIQSYLLCHMFFRNRVLQSGASIRVPKIDRRMYKLQSSPDDEHNHWQSKTSSEREETKTKTVSKISPTYILQTFHRDGGRKIEIVL